MTEEFKVLLNNIDEALFIYAHITAALELYIDVLTSPNLQRAISKVVNGSETEWKSIHRFMNLEGGMVIWYPELPTEVIIARKDALFGFFYGIILTRMVSDLDYYLASVLKNHFRTIDTSGSSWERFIKVTGIDLLQKRHGRFIYTLLQERHKIVHNKAIIDRVFLERLAQRSIRHVYREGDSIGKSHIDILLTHQAITEFAKEIDLELSKRL